MNRIIHSISQKTLANASSINTYPLHPTRRYLSTLFPKTTAQKKAERAKLPKVPREPEVPTNSKLSFVHHPYSLTEEALPAPGEQQKNSFFAIVEFSGTQYKVTEDDVIVANKLEKIDIGDNITLGKVLMVGSKHGTILGHPYIEGAKVTGDIEEITKDKKVIIFKMRRRKNSKRTRGFRRSVTIIRVKDITIDESLAEFTKRM